MTKCILCELEEAGSLEHILPKGLYSGQFSDLFRTRSICKKCNHKNGLYIDGAFLLDPFISVIRSESNVQYMSSKHINSSRVDMYFYQNSYLYVISEVINEFNTYVGGIPTQRRRNLVFIEINQNFDLNNFQQYFESIAKIIYKSIGTKNIYFKTPITINLNIDCEVATSEQLTQYFNQHGIFQFENLSEDEKKLVNSIFAIFSEEVNNHGHYKMGFQLDLKIYPREFSKIAFLLGHKLFGQAYLSTMNARMHKSVMSDNFYPFQNLFCDNLHSNELSNIINTLKHKLSQETPKIIIFTMIFNNELHLFVIYGNKYMQVGFCVLITDEVILINEFNDKYLDKLFIIKSCAEEHYSKYDNFEELISSFLTN